MERVMKSIENISEMDDPHLKDALFRDAVVTYVKPFTSNKGENIKNGLRLNEKGIPKDLKAAHKSLIDIRDKIFAHNDLEYQSATFGPGSSFTVKGYEYFFSEDLLSPLNDLASTMHEHLRNEMVMWGH